jgi:hypothetical protein
MNDGRVRDLEFRVKDLQGEIKALKKKLANIVYVVKKLANIVYVVIGYYSSGAASISEDLGDIYLYDSLDKAEKVVRIWEESNPHEYSRWEIEEKEVE